MAAKLTASDCIDPDLSKVSEGERLMLCDGTIAEGTLILAAPDSPDPWEVRYGVTVGSTTGKLKVNCRNMVDHYDGAGGYTGGSTTLHTIDDFNWDGAAAGGFPSINPWSNDEYFCGFNDPIDPNWKKVITTSATSGVNSIFEDKITGLKWSRGSSTGALAWDDAAGGAPDTGAIEYCAGLDRGGVEVGSWRLPTQKELMAAYANGIRDLGSDHTTPNHLGNLATNYSSSSTTADNITNAWIVDLRSGFTSIRLKSDSSSVLCVAQ